ncbi:MAG TPA: helix-turn-helix domain-containing protein [Acidimicrobiales bacterium]|nr:helix-turn-helix domain-containing protein [Acidimicrobiales bacterium]
MDRSGSAPSLLAYRVEDAARELSMSRRQVYRLLATGELLARKTGSRTLIERVELVRFLRRQRQYRPSGAA